MRSLALLLLPLISLIAATLPAQISFETQGPICQYGFPVLATGTCPPAVGDPEGVGWNGQGIATVDPIPTCGMPCLGSQYARIGSAGPFSAPPGGPALRPTAVPAELKIPIPAGAVSVSLCWEFFNSAGPSNFFSNDGMSIDVVDCNGNLVTPIAYADTFSALGPCQDPSFCGNMGFEDSSVPGGFQTVTNAPLGTMPAGGWYLSVMVWNGVAPGSRSFGVIDGISFGTGSGPVCPIGDDGFDIPCCQIVNQSNLPNFPPIALRGQYACLRNCGVELDEPVDVDVTMSQILCDYFFMSLNVSPIGANGPTFTPTTLLAKYSRTWIENLGGGQTRQVWRFLINGDVTYAPHPVTGAPPVGPCPTPPSHLGPNGTPVHMTGHIDYACEPDPLVAGANVWRLALGLSHWNGNIAHAFYGCRPIPSSNPAAHPDRSYHLIAPAGFTWGSTASGIAVTAPQGPLQAEATRTSRIDNVLGYVCHGETDVQQGSLTTQFQSCVGGTAATGYEHQVFNGTVACNGTTSSFSNLSVPPIVPPGPTGFVAHPLGAWSNPPGVFPGSRQLTNYFGLVSFPVPCDSTAFPLSITTGVATDNAGIVFGGLNPNTPMRQFIDLQQTLKFNALLPGWGPGWGATFVSFLVWNLNMP